MVFLYLFAFGRAHYDEIRNVPKFEREKCLELEITFITFIEMNGTETSPVERSKHAFD